MEAPVHRLQWSFFDSRILSLIRVQGHKASYANLAVKNDIRKYSITFLHTLYQPCTNFAQSLLSLRK